MDMERADDVNFLTLRVVETDTCLSTGRGLRSI